VNEHPEPIVLKPLGVTLRQFPDIERNGFVFCRHKKSLKHCEFHTELSKYAWFYDFVHIFMLSMHSLKDSMEKADGASPILA
jgi:hypothetical protein